VLQLAALTGFPFDQFRVAAAPDTGKNTTPHFNFLALPQSPDPRGANRVHRFPRNGGREALISYARDENIQTLAPRRERLNS
jgi:hypothetical protein